MKKTANRVYVIHFKDKENMDKYLKKNPFTVLDNNDKIFTVTVQMQKSDLNKFFDLIVGINVITFDEKPYTLQDYFMSFYKEEKEFGGLEGVKGNKK